MEDEYGMGDLRHYIDGRPLFPAISQPPDLLSCHRRSYPYDMLIFRPTTADSTALAPSDGGVVVGFEAEAGGMGGGGDGGAGRWPRQETLTLLEIRSRLNPKFKEANQKIPLWDEVARIMWQEHGYQRSGKKCREKFENLYKYYKKTKEGKAGRQDGKHYRFFRQLEALYGDAATTTSAAATHFHHAPNYNFPNSSTDQEPYPPLSTSECDTTTSSYCTDSNIDADADDARLKKKKGKMRRKIEASIEAQMRSMTEKQEAWMERMTRAMEEKEQERLMREEQWRRQDAARIDGEHKMWAAEKAWIESRDAALMDAFTKLVGRGIEADHPRPPPPPLWPDNEVAWDDACGGGMCREKWDHVIGDYLIKCSKKRKDDPINRDPIINLSDHGGVSVAGVLHGNGNLQRNGGGNVNDAGLFRYFIGDSYQRL